MEEGKKKCGSVRMMYQSQNGIDEIKKHERGGKGKRDFKEKKGYLVS